MKTLMQLFAVMSALGGLSQAADKTLIDYFLPTPIRGQLTTEAWGAPNVLPRDPRNGLEDATIKQWCYWDGQVLKGPDGKYHLRRPTESTVGRIGGEPFQGGAAHRQVTNRTVNQASGG